MRKLRLISTITGALCATTAACIPSGWNPTNWGSGGGKGGAANNANGGAAAQKAERVSRDLAVTSAAKGLVRLTSTPANEQRPMMSPDGKLLLASSWITDSESGETANQKVVGVKPTGGPVTAYTARAAADCPVWLGKSFAYSSNALGSWNLVRALKPSPNAATSVVVGAQTAPELCPTSASPDGKLLALHTRTGEDFQIATVESNGGSFTVVAEGAFPKISPDGRTIVFNRKVAEHFQVFTVGLDGDGLTQITNGDSNCETPSWSPDGKWLVMACNNGWNRYGDDPSAVFNLYVTKPDGSDTIALTSGGHGVTHPHWAKDGWIYFSSNAGGSWDLWRTQPTLPD